MSPNNQTFSPLSSGKFPFGTPFTSSAGGIEKAILKVRHLNVNHSSAEFTVGYFVLWLTNQSHGIGAFPHLLLGNLFNKQTFESFVELAHI